MRRHTTVPTLLAPLLLLPLTASTGEELRIELGADAEVRTTLTFENRLEIVGGAMRLMDQTEEMPDDFTLEIVNRCTSTAVDRFPNGAEDDRAEIVRTFEAIEQTVAFEVAEGDRSAEGTVELESPLVDESVRFTVADGERLCLPADEEDDLDTELLEPLRADLGAWCLLPDGAVEPGATWTVEGAALAELLLPGGLLPMTEAELIEAEGDDADDLGQVALFLFGGVQYALDDLEGEVELSFVGLEDGVAVVGLAGSIEGSGDDVELAQALIDGLAEDEDAPEVESYEVSTELELEGELRWNLEAGRVESLSWTAEVSSEVEMELADPSMPDAMSIELEFEGRATLELTIP
jgi:hypothetical protein